MLAQLIHLHNISIVHLTFVQHLYNKYNTCPTFQHLDHLCHLSNSCTTLPTIMLLVQILLCHSCSTCTTHATLVPLMQHLCHSSSTDATHHILIPLTRHPQHQCHSCDTRQSLYRPPNTYATNMHCFCRAQSLLDQYRQKSMLYLNNVVLVPLGDDFRFETATEWDQQFTNYQRLFDYMNQQGEWSVEVGVVGFKYIIYDFICN